MFVFSFYGRVNEKLGEKKEEIEIWTLKFQMKNKMYKRKDTMRPYYIEKDLR